MKAEEYIKKYTKKCSNTISNARGLFSPWLTPYHAGEIAKMAKEEGKKEMLENVCEWLKENGTHYWWDEEDDDGLNDLRKAMEDKE